MDYRGDQVDNMIQRERLTAKQLLENTSVISRAVEIERAALWRDGYTFSHFMNELGSRETGNHFVNFEVAQEWLIPRMLKFIRVIEKGEKLVIFKNDREPEILKLEVFLRSYNERKGNSFSFQLLKKLKTGDYFQFLIQDRIFSHSKIDFIPFTKFEDDPAETGILNTFQGFQVDPVPLGQVDEALINPILYHLKEVWSAGDEEIYRYLVGWLGSLFKYPRKRLPMVILHGLEGTGKTCLIQDFIAKLIFGDELVGQFNSISDITGQFNGLREDKVLIYLREMACAHQSGNTVRNQINMMKDMITDETMPINWKYINQYIKTNYNHFIGTTNHEVVLRVTADQRRFFSTTVSDRHKRDRPYFKMLYASFTQEVANHFYSWCIAQMDTEWLEDFNPEEFPVTEVMETTIEASKLPPETFVTEVLNGEAYIRIPSTLAEKELKERGKDEPWFCTREDIYTSFKHWCITSGYTKPDTKKGFFGFVRRVTEWGPVKKRYGKSGYFIPVSQISIYHSVNDEDMSPTEFIQYTESELKH